MEETLTDCLVRVKEDLDNLKRVREYLDKNRETEECCCITWRTIEAFNSILGVCSSQHTPETNALDTLLDSFYYLARNNSDSSIWNDFGFELGLICVKVLSAIDRSEIFEVLFCKLLTVINVICEQNTNVWKASARQILNVLINKKFSLSYFETILKLYISVLRNVDGFALHSFSTQNLHLLKTLSMLVPRVGDFEIQSDIMELVFLHLPNSTASMSDFFATSERKLFESLQFANFEKDSRTYLNALNKPRGGLERKVYSVSCHVVFLGGRFVEPPVGLDSLWVDANGETKRLSVRCADAGSEGNRVIYVPFSDILHVELSKETTEGRRCLTIRTRSLSQLQFDVKNDDVCLMVEEGEASLEILDFLTSQIKRKNRHGRKVSKTAESLLVDRNNLEEVQDNAVTSSEKRGVDHILPDIFNLFESGAQPATKAIQSSGTLTKKITTPPRSQEQKTVAGSQELSPNSFVESLEKHIGRESPGIPRSFEDSVETIEFMQRANSRGGHKLFRSPQKEFEILKEEDASNFSFIFEEEKENKPKGNRLGKPKTYERKREEPRVSDVTRRILRERKNFEAKLADTQSQEYFQQSASALRKKKPSLPKLKRRSKGKTEKENRESECEGGSKHSKKAMSGEREIVGESKDEERGSQEKQRKENPRKSRERGKTVRDETQKKASAVREREEPERKPRKQRTSPQEQRPSLLDPNGYAFRRWCEPTTSERGSFWLKKLNAMQKPKTNANVFNFSDNSDSDSGKIKKKKRRVVHSKRSHRTKEANQTSLKEVKDILRKTSPRGKEAVLHRRSTNPERNLQRSPPEQVPESPDRGCCRGPPQESAVASDDESDLPNGGDTSPVRTKLPKSVLLSGNVLSTLRNRLLEKEKKDRRETEEIIQAVNKSVNHLFNHLQRREGGMVKSYLATAEEAVAVVQSEVQGLSLRSLRVERAMLYFRAGCSVAGTCESLEGEFSGVRSSLRGLAQRKDVSGTIDRVNERLLEVIKSGIDKSIERELESRRNRLLKCASLLDDECGKFG